MNYISTNMHPDHKCITDSVYLAAYRTYQQRRAKIRKRMKDRDRIFWKMYMHMMHYTPEPFFFTTSTAEFIPNQH